MEKKQVNRRKKTGQVKHRNQRDQMQNKHRRRTDESTSRRQRQSEEIRRRPSKKHRRRKRKNPLKKWLPIIFSVLVVVLAIYFVRNIGEGNKYNKKGIASYENGDYETAATYFAKAIDYDGTHTDYYMNQGMAQTELKLYDDAAASLERALELAKKGRDKQMVYRAMGILEMYQGNYTQSIENFDQALDGKTERFSSLETDILYYKAETQEKAGLYVDAVLTYTQIVDTEKSADAYMLRGLAYVNAGDQNGAEEDLRTAIKKDKKDYEIYHTLFDVLKKQGKNDEANAVLQEALKLGGSKAEDLANQGQIYAELGDYVTAEEKLKKALDKGANTANLGYAKLYEAQKKYSSAVPYYEAYLEKDATNAQVYNEYGNCLMEMGEYAKAEEIFTKGVQLNNRLIDRVISKNQISAAEHAGNWAKALEYMDTYLQKYADDEEAARERTFIQTRIR